jgi:hypothetical protein
MFSNLWRKMRDYLTGFGAAPAPRQQPARRYRPAGWETMNERAFFEAALRRAGLSVETQLPQALPGSKEYPMSARSWRKWLTRLSEHIGKRRQVQASRKNRSAVIRAQELEPRLLLTGLAAPYAGWFTPAQIRGAYGFDQIPSFVQNGQAIPADGRGQTIAIIDAGDNPNVQTDLATFSDPKNFNLRPMDGQNGHPWFRKVNETGGTSLPTAAPNWQGEIDLDVEWAHAMAQGANIVLVEANPTPRPDGTFYITPSDVATAANTAVNQFGASVVSMSFSGDPNAYILSHRGVTFVSTAGDTGQFETPGGNYTSLIVGGTYLNTNNTVYRSEVVWNNGDGSSGGGKFTSVPLPSWQFNAATNWATKSGTGIRPTTRMSPDVAYVADVLAYVDAADLGASTPWGSAHGTSLGAPQWAALIAIANEGRALELPSRGPLNQLDPTLPMLYSLPSADFRQIPSSGSAFDTTGAGSYVVASLGSPRADYIIPDLIQPYVGSYSQLVGKQLVVYGNIQGGSDQITISKQVTDQATYVVISDNGQTDRFDASTFSSIEVNTRAGFNTVDVQSLPAVTPITINMNGVSDTLTVDSTAYASTVTANLGSGTETVNIEGTGDAVTVYDGSGSDTVNISPTAQDLSTLGGDVTVYGGGGTGTVNVNDQGHQDLQGNSNYWLTASSVRRTNANTVYFFGQSRVEIYGASGTETYNVGTEESGPVAAPAGSARNALVELFTNGTQTNRINVVDELYADSNNNLHFSLDGLGGFFISGHATDTVVVNNTRTPALPAGTTVNARMFTLTTDPAAGPGVTMEYSVSKGPGSIVFGASSFSYSGIGALEIDGGSPGEQFKVGDGNNNLDFLPKTVTIQGAGGDSLVINDTPNAPNASNAPAVIITQTTPTYTITSQSVTRKNAISYTVFGKPGTATVTSEIDYSGLAGLELDGGTSANIFDVQSTAPATITTIKAGAGGDTVNVSGASGQLNIVGATLVHIGSGNIGAGTLQGVSAVVTILQTSNQQVSTNVVVDDSMDPNPVTATLHFRLQNLSGALTGLTVLDMAGAEIAADQYDSWTIDGPAQAANMYTVNDTSSGRTILQPGLGTVQVNHTDGELDIQGGQHVIVGNNGRLTGPLGTSLLDGSVIVTNLGASFIDVTVDDSQDPNPVNATLGLRLQNSSGVLTPLAVLDMAGDDIATDQYISWTIKGPAQAGNLYTVNDSSHQQTILQPGLGTVQVNNTDGELDIQGGQHVTVGNGHFKALFDHGADLISGLVNVTNPAGNGLLRTVDLTIDDSLDTVGRTIALTSQSNSSSTITGLNSAGLEFNPLNLTALTIKGGNGGNTFNLQATAAGMATIIKAGTGGDTVNVGSDPVNLSQSILDGIHGAVTVTGAGGNTALNVHDDGNPVTENYTVSPTTIQRSVNVAGVYNYNIATISYYTVGHVKVYVGTATGQNQGAFINTLDVVGTLAGTATDLYGNNAGGQTQFAATPYVDVHGYNAKDQILGAVHFHGSSIGLDTAGLYDYFDRAPQSYVMTAGQIVDAGTIANGQIVPSGFAPVTYDGRLYGAGLTTSAVGGSAVSLSSTGTLVTGALGFGTVVEANPGDTVTVGSQAPALGGTLSQLGTLNLGTVPGSNGPATFILDDSGDTQMGKQVTFNTDSYAWGISGLSLGRIYFGGGSKNVQVLGGSPAAGQPGGNTYDIESVPAGFSLAVNAGKGTDTVNVGSDPVNLPQSILDGIQGAVTVTGTGVNTTLNFNDQGGNPGPGQAYSYTLEQDTFSRTGTATVNFTRLTTVNVNGTNAGTLNSLSVASTLPATTYNVNAGTGGNQFILAGDKANNDTLNGIQGPLFLHGNGLTTVSLYDVFNKTPETFTLTAGTTSQSGIVKRSGSSVPGSPPDMAAISYDGIFRAALETANAYSSSGLNGDTVLVQGNAPNILTSVLVGTGDTVTVGNASHTMDGISGDLRIQNALAPERPTVILDDAGDKNSRTITMGNDPNNSYGFTAYLFTGLLPSSIPGHGNLWVGFGDPAASVSLKTGSGDDVFKVTDFTNAPTLTLDGGGGNNTLQGPNIVNTWLISGANSGTLDGTVKFVSMQNLIGGSANDTFDFKTGGSLAGKIDGGAGTNTLDYSAFLGDVTVDLPLGLATAVAKGILNIQNVNGSQGNDLIVGDANANVLRGGTGRNIIIGGGGGDQIFGGGGDNLLIGGSTDYVGASGLTALEAIMNEFEQPYAFSTRVTNIKKGIGTLAGTGYHLNSSNVHADLLTDQIWGGGGLNWFFAASPSELDGGTPIGANDAYTHVK